MDNFIVSARKYRPKTFDTVVAQGSITSTLKNAIRNNQIAQAFLFCGPRGVGKTTCARILAKTINCENLSENLEPCGECAPCRSFNEYASFNIHELDAASNNSVDDIRSLVEQVRVPPQVGKYKVYIIDEVHMLSANAFNAFLKTLEEPPAYAKFILATTEKHKIIPTILSRCQIYDFKRITVDEIVSYLEFVAEKEGVETNPDALHIIAQKADGAMRDALTIFDQLVSFSGKKITYQNVLDNLNVLDYDYYFQLTDYLYNGNISESLMLLDKVIDMGFDGQHFIIGFGEHLRNLLVCKDAITIDLLEVSQNIKEKYKSQASRCEAQCLIKSLELINKCDINYKTSNNKRLLLELTLMQMCQVKQFTVHSPQSTVVSQPLAVSSKQPVPINRDSVQSTVSSQQSVPINRDSKQATEEVKKEIKQPEILRSKVISINPQKPKEAIKKDIKTEDAANAGEIDQNLYNDSDFSQEMLTEVWANYAADVIDEQPGFYATLTKYTPILKDNFSIELTLDNAAQEEVLKEKKMELLDYLRANLKNNKVNITTIITDSPKLDKPYTSTEKYNRMKEKNPNLETLKNQLGLEID